MIAFFHRWIYQDIYQPVWPNWVAGGVAAVVAYFWKGKKWLRKHEEHQRKITEIHDHLNPNKDFTIGSEHSYNNVKEKI